LPREGQAYTLGFFGFLNLHSKYHDLDESAAKVNVLCEETQRRRRTFRTGTYDVKCELENRHKHLAAMASSRCFFTAG
jgi:hypothetical protein